MSSLLGVSRPSPDQIEKSTRYVYNQQRFSETFFCIIANKRGIEDGRIRRDASHYALLTYCVKKP